MPIVDHTTAVLPGWVLVRSDALEVDVVLRYAVAEPSIVVVGFAVLTEDGEPEEFRMRVQRDALRAGLVEPVVAGPFTVEPCRELLGALDVTLTTETATVSLRLPWDRARRFLARTVELMPAGATCAVVSAR
jgi:hypothetical protein